MIRPFTIATFLMACGSGLYLYQSKHEVQLLDKTIERTVHDTGALREQSRLLAAEWTMLNDPDRLRQFSDTYLNSLHSISPAQFTSLTDLDARLPAVKVPPPPEPEAAAPVPIPEDSSSRMQAQPANPVAARDDALPLPPIAAPHAPVAVARPEHKPPAARPMVAEIPPPRVQAQAEPRLAEPRLAEPRLAEPRLAEPRLAEQHAARMPEARPSTPPTPRAPLQAQAPAPAAAPRPMPAYPANPNFAASAPYGGSLLGMARGSSPVPRPMPVNATYNN
jgi:hypothetical protein